MKDNPDRHFLIYVTANEGDLSSDIVNLMMMNKYHPGVSKVEVVLVISDLEPESNYFENRFFLRICCFVVD